MQDVQTLDHDVPYKLHERDQMAPDGAPEMTQEFLAALEVALSSSRPARQDGRPCDLATARARLRAEYPTLSQVVEACCYGDIAQSDFAHDLGISRQRVNARLQQGLALLREWLPAGIREERRDQS